jgi:hypothetical protein
VSENNPENVDGEAGEELVNGGRTVTNMETESAKKPNMETKSVEEANVETNNANQATKSDEKPVANEVKATSSEAENEALNNELAANHSHWKALPLETDWFDVYVTDVKDPENFTVCRIFVLFPLTLRRSVCALFLVTGKYILFLVSLVSTSS